MTCQEFRRLNNLPSVMDMSSVERGACAVHWRDCKLCHDWMHEHDSKFPPLTREQEIATKLLVLHDSQDPEVRAVINQRPIRN